LPALSQMSQEGRRRPALRTRRTDPVLERTTPTLIPAYRQRRELERFLKGKTRRTWPTQTSGPPREQKRRRAIVRNQRRCHGKLPATLLRGKPTERGRLRPSDRPYTTRARLPPTNGPRQRPTTADPNPQRPGNTNKRLRHPANANHARIYTYPGRIPQATPGADLHHTRHHVADDHAEYAHRGGEGPRNARAGARGGGPRRGPSKPAIHEGPRGSVTLRDGLSRTEYGP
jgi:hypothetical protein